MSRISPIRIGSPAPDFCGHTHTGEEIRLADFRERKNVVLFFYPKDFTPGCTAEVCSLRDNYDEIRRYDAVMFGVSFDSEESHRQFIRRHRLPFPLLSDPDGAIAQAYGADRRFWGVLPGARRITFVIDKKGIIREILHHELMIGRHVQGVLEALRRIES